MIINKEFIINRMYEKRVTKTDLTKLFEISYTALASKLNGKTDFKFSEAWLLTQVLDCEMNDLLKKEEA